MREERREKRRENKYDRGERRKKRKDSWREKREGREKEREGEREIEVTMWEHCCIMLMMTAFIASGEQTVIWSEKKGERKRARRREIG
jgi:hypothetical protein